MGIRDKFEPPYPSTRDELERYCVRLIKALTNHLGDELVCVLLNGSWARGEANPPASDADITVIVNQIDTTNLDRLRQAWDDSEMGYANIYSRAEVAMMSHIALEMYTTNAVVLWGDNPFPQPTRADFAEDVALNVESVARYARHMIVCTWRTPEEILEKLSYLRGDLKRLMQNMIAFRTGTFPRNQRHLEETLAGTAELALLNRVVSLGADDIPKECQAVAEEVNDYVNRCVAEVEVFRRSRR